MAGLNKSTGNMYEFVTHTWNTVKGECPHGCSYCYMKRWGKQPDLHFEEKELKTDLGKGNIIFVGSSCDMFAEEVPVEWIARTIEHCMKAENIYFFQTKNPKRFFETVPEQIFNRVILCITVESNRWDREIMQNAPQPLQRLYALNDYLRYPILRPSGGVEWIERPDRSLRLFLTIEPIMQMHIGVMTELVKCIGFEQVNIGADSGRNNLPEPSSEEVRALIEELSKFTKVVVKKNLKRIIREEVYL